MINNFNENNFSTELNFMYLRRLCYRYATRKLSSHINCSGTQVLFLQASPLEIGIPSIMKLILIPLLVT